MKRTNYARPVKYLLTLFILGFLGWYVYSNWEQFANLELSQPLFLIPAVAAFLLNVFLMGLLIEQVIRVRGIKLKFGEIFGLSILTRFSKQFAPGYLGFTVRAVYLKKHFGISYAHFSSGLILSNILQFFISGLIVLILLAVGTTLVFSNSIFLLVALFVMMFAAMLIMPGIWIVNSIKWMYKRWHVKPLERLVAAAEEFNNIKKHPSFFINTTLLMLVTVAVSGFNMTMLYSVFDYSIPPVAALFIVCLTSWITFFSITPSDIGVREGLMALGAQIMGIPVPLTLAISVLMRLLNIATLAILSLYFAPKLLNTSLINLNKVKEDT